MSYVLFVHTRHQIPIEIARLTERMRGIGWEIRVLDTAPDEPVVVAAGPIPEDGMVFGWDCEDPDADRCDALFPFGGTVDLYRLPDDIFSLDGCELSWEVDPSSGEEMDPEDWAEMTRGLPPEKLDLLREARIGYHLRTGAHVNPFRFIFQWDLCLAVAQECRGLIADPQEGEYHWFNEVKTDPRTPIPRGVAHIDRMLSSLSLWHRILYWFKQRNDTEETPPLVNALTWGVAFEAGFRGYALVSRFWRESPHPLSWAILGIPFLFVYIGLEGNWRWAWWGALVSLPLVIGIELLLSLRDGFGFFDGFRLAFAAVVVILLLLPPVREHFCI
jgi:hypothetical protein